MFMLRKKPKKQNIRIAIWGGVEAGKSTYLTMLYRYLDSHSDWNLKVSPSFLDIVYSFSRNLEDYGQFPDRRFPFPENEVQCLNYILNPNKNIGINQVDLSFLAAPGKFYETGLMESIRVIENQIPGAKEPKSYDTPIDYFLSCDGIIILLDKQAESCEHSLRNFLMCLKVYWRERNQGNQKVPHYLAFCLSKADKHDDYWNLDNDQGTNENLKRLSSLIQKTIGQATFESLQGDFYLNHKKPNNPNQTHCRFYYLSAIGRYFDKGKKVYLQVVGNEENNVNNLDSEIGYSDPDGGIFGLEQTQEFSYIDKQSIYKIQHEYLTSLESLNVFSPLEWMISTIPHYPLFRLSQ